MWINSHWIVIADCLTFFMHFLYCLYWMCEKLVIKVLCKLMSMSLINWMSDYTAEKKQCRKKYKTNLLKLTYCIVKLKSLSGSNCWKIYNRKWITIGQMFPPALFIHRIILIQIQLSWILLVIHIHQIIGIFRTQMDFHLWNRSKV